MHNIECSVWQLSFTAGWGVGGCVCVCVCVCVGGGGGGGGGGGHSWDINGKLYKNTTLCTIPGEYAMTQGPLGHQATAMYRVEFGN